MLEDFEKEPVVRSPDGSNAVHLTKDHNFRITASGATIAKFSLPDVESNIEVDWAPDSKQFFISYSGGYSIGAYHVHLYRVAERALSESKVPQLVVEDFKTKHWCEARGNNLFFLDWTPDSTRAFLVAEVFPTGDCGSETGVYRGYLVSVTDVKVLRVFGERDTTAIEKNCRASGKLFLPTAPDDNWCEIALHVNYFTLPSLRASESVLCRVPGTEQAATKLVSSLTGLTISSTCCPGTHVPGCELSRLRRSSDCSVPLAESRSEFRKSLRMPGYFQSPLRG